MLAHVHVLDEFIHVSIPIFFDFISTSFTVLKKIFQALPLSLFEGKFIVKTSDSKVVKISRNGLKYQEITPHIRHFSTIKKMLQTSYKQQYTPNTPYK